MSGTVRTVEPKKLGSVDGNMSTEVWSQQNTKRLMSFEQCFMFHARGQHRCFNYSHKALNVSTAPSVSVVLGSLQLRVCEYHIMRSGVMPIFSK